MGSMKRPQLRLVGREPQRAVGKIEHAAAVISVAKRAKAYAEYLRNAHPDYDEEISMALELLDAEVKRTGSPSMVAFVAHAATGKIETRLDMAKMLPWAMAAVWEDARARGGKGPQGRQGQERDERKGTGMNGRA